MQKKKLALAIGAAMIVTAAHAQKKAEPDSVIVLYGKVYPELVFPSSSGATAAGTATCSICSPATGTNEIIELTEIESSNSRLGVRGHERLGPNLKAIFQLETQFKVDQNDTPFARRDSFIGLTGGWGTVKLGRMDTPFKEYGDDISFLSVSSGNFTSTSAVFRHIGMGPQQNAARFHERRVNAVQYESPELGPIDFKIQWSTDEGKTATRNPQVFSAGMKYEVGPLEVSIAHEIHEDLFGLSRNVPTALSNFTNQGAASEDTATAIGFKFKLGKVHQIGIEANQKKYRESGVGTVGKVTSYKNNAYLVAWDARWSNRWRTAVHYVKATAGECTRFGAECNTNGLKGEQFSAGFAYHFTRRTFLFVMGSYLKNDYSARFNNSSQDVNPGEDITQVAIGLHTQF